MKKFIRKLKELEIYDKSLIIFKSDHGKPAYYFNNNMIESFKIKENESWGFNRYTPFLMIKDFDYSANRLEFNGEPSLLDDLAKTLCIAARLSNKCNIYNGFNLLDRDLKIPSSEKAFIFLVKDKESDFSFKTHRAYEINREKNFYQNINQLMLREHLSEKLGCHSGFRVDEGRAYNNGYSNYSNWATWRNGNSKFIAFTMRNCNTDFLVEFETTYDIDTLESFQIRLNNKTISLNTLNLRMNTKNMGAFRLQPTFLTDKDINIIEFIGVGEKFELSGIRRVDIN